MSRQPSRQRSWCRADRLMLDDDAERLRGVVVLPHDRRLLFSDDVELDAAKLSGDGSPTVPGSLLEGPIVPDSIAPTRRAFRLQFGMQSILRMIVGIAIVLWLLDFWVRVPYRAEQQAAANLVHAGGKVLLVEDTQGWAPRYLGSNLFDTRIAAMVDLSHSRVTDADLVNLRSFDRVGQLTLSDTAITNAGLVHLRHVVAGRFIDLSRTGVTAHCAVVRPKSPRSSVGPQALGQSDRSRNVPGRVSSRWVFVARS